MAAHGSAQLHEAGVPSCFGAPSTGTLVRRLRHKSSSSSSSDECEERPDGGEDAGWELGAVVVTIRNGASYDDVFHRVPQQGVGGTYVATYEIAGSLAPVWTALAEGRTAEEGPLQSMEGDLEQLVEDVGKLEASSVVFNWECCSACSDESFGTAAETRVVLDLMQLLLGRGHMVMCSDFSLKALIRQWSEPHLGPNPFVKVGECQGHLQLRFDAARVAACPSAQLQRAGDLCERGRAQVEALAGTVVFTVDGSVLPQAIGTYALEVLTVVDHATGLDELARVLPVHQLCEAAGHRGAAGHVVLRYASGGALLASAGHWVELVEMDVSEERLIETAAAQYGEVYSQTLERALCEAPSLELRSQICQKAASHIVQQSTPGTYSAAAQTRASSSALKQPPPPPPVATWVA